MKSVPPGPAQAALLITWRADVLPPAALDPKPSMTSQGSPYGDMKQRRSRVMNQNIMSEGCRAQPGDIQEVGGNKWSRFRLPRLFLGL